jgi:cytidylate kinase
MWPYLESGIVFVPKCRGDARGCLFLKGGCTMSLITITAGIGCEGMVVARLVSDGLKLELYDDERLQEEAVKNLISREALGIFDEKAPALFSRLLSHKPEVYLDLLEALIYEVARHGKGVILGHGAQFLLRDFGCALHVCIYASESTRIQNLMDQQGVSRNAAEKMIHKSDSERRGFMKFAFHMDRDDPGSYDLIINRDKLSAGSGAALIMQVAQSQEITTCSVAALNVMERLSLSKRVEAALLKNKIPLVNLRVEVPEKGVVEVTGVLHSQHLRDHLLEVVQAVPGVSEVRSEVSLIILGSIEW